MMRFRPLPAYINLLVGSVLLIVGFLTPVQAQKGQGGTESNLNYGFGTRALALGSAFTAMADDPTAVFWNPAGLEYIDQQCATLFHSSLWEGASYDFLGYVLPTLNFGTLGLGVGRIGVGDIPETDQYYNKLGKFSNEEIHLFLSYSKKLPLNLTPGITLRIVRRSWSSTRQFGSLVDNGIGLDLGMMYRPDWLGSPWLQDWSFGFNLQNIFAPQLKEGTLSDVFPFACKLGFYKKFRLIGGDATNVVFDFDYSSKRDLRLHFGTEYRLRELGSLRIGYGAGGFSLGAAVEYKMFQFEYAYTQNEYSDLLAPVNRISLSVNFGPTRDDLYARARQELIEEQAQVLADLQETQKEQFCSDHIRTGNGYLTDHKYLDAIVEYQQVLNRDSLNTRARSLLDSANTLLQHQSLQLQSVAVKNALDQERVKSDRQFVEQHFAKGRTLLDQNQFTEALAEFNLAFERDTSDATVSNALHTTRRRIDEEVTRLLQRSRQELDNQNHAESLVLLADARDLHTTNRQLEQQIESLTRQVNIQKNLQRGILLYQIKEYEKALAVLEDVLALDPENVLAKDYAEKCKIETISKTTKMDQESEQQYLEGMNAYLAGSYQLAVTIWEQILIQHPYNKKILSAIQGAREKMKQGVK
jgi:tetratricopeptide (TPR) repeat protein